MRRTWSTLWRESKAWAESRCLSGAPADAQSGEWSGSQSLETSLWSRSESIHFLSTKTLWAVFIYRLLCYWSAPLGIKSFCMWPPELKWQSHPCLIMTSSHSRSTTRQSLAPTPLFQPMRTPREDCCTRVCRAISSATWKTNHRYRCNSKSFQHTRLQVSASSCRASPIFVCRICVFCGCRTRDSRLTDCLTTVLHDTL